MPARDQPIAAADPPLYSLNVREWGHDVRSDDLADEVRPQPESNTPWLIP
jgi:hypothetical protein